MKYDLEKTVVHCTTQEEFDKVLKWHANKGNVWANKEHPLFNRGKDFEIYSKETTLELKNYFGYGSIEYSNGKTITISFSQFERDFLNKKITEQPEPSVKNDFKDNKLRWDLLPLDLVEEVVKVYHAGAKKYGANRWQNLEDGESRYFGAMMRHIRASQIEDIDEDTGCYHLAQVCFNALAMLHFKLKEKEE